MASSGGALGDRDSGIRADIGPDNSPVAEALARGGPVEETKALVGSAQPQETLTRAGWPNGSGYAGLSKHESCKLHLHWKCRGIRDGNALGHTLGPVASAFLAIRAVGGADRLARRR